MRATLCRRFQTGLVALKGAKWEPPLAKRGYPVPGPDKGKSFDANFVNPRAKPKAWEGKNKDEFFGLKYAETHKRQAAKGQNGQRRRPKEVEKPKKTPIKMASKVVKNGDPDKEYIYGTRVILSAIEADKGPRRIYQMFTSNEEATTMPAIREYCETHHIRRTYKVSKQDLNRLCDNGLHNGYVALVSKREDTPVASLANVDVESNTFTAKAIGDRGAISDQSFEFSKTNRYPLGIYIDEITDARNLGAIIRSAYYLGADFIVRSERSSAPISPVSVKTSSGASEHINILSAPQPIKFFENTREAGWQIVATSLDPVNKANITNVPVSGLKDLLKAGPCLMVLGAEGEGLRTNLLNRSTHAVRWRGLVPASKLDSLNVSVAAALLISKFQPDDRFD